MNQANELAGGPVMAYHLLRYTPDLVRDESLNIGVLVFNPDTGEVRLRMVEEPAEFARIRRLLPTAEEKVIRNLHDHLQDRLAEQLSRERLEQGTSLQPGLVVQKLVAKWDSTLSNSFQLLPQKGVHSDDLDYEVDRLYQELVALRRPETAHRELRGRALLREYCTQVFRQAGLWTRLEKSVRISEFTFPGDPTRIDFAYRRNGTRGFVQCLSLAQAPKDCSAFAHTVDRVVKTAPFASEFTTVTDIELDPERNLRHRFIRDTLRESEIATVQLGGFATWVAKLRAQLN